MKEKDISLFVQKVLDEAHLMSLGTIDENGPWVCDLIFVHGNDLSLYWLSHEKTRHSQAILKDPRVAGSITVSNNVGEPDFGVQFEGIARKVDGVAPDIAKQYRIKCKKPLLAVGETLIKTAGISWYCLRPSHYELIHKSLFDFKKQNLILGS